MLFYYLSSILYIGNINFAPIPILLQKPANVEQSTSKVETEQEDDNATLEAVPEPAVQMNERRDNEISQSTKKIAKKWLARTRARLYNAR
jgi:hypothetical protein